MAGQDLGDIKYTNVNAGTTPVGDEGVSQGIIKSLQLGKQLRDDYVVGEVKGDMLEAIAVQQTDSQVVETPVIEYEKGSREQYLFRRMEELEGVMAQGTISQRGLAELSVKNIMAEAEIKYPRLAQEIKAAGMGVLQSNAGLDKLGIDDKLRSVEAEKAENMYTAMVDKAQLDWDKGGYGIDPSIDPRSSEFARLYEENSIYKRVTEDGARSLALLTAQAQRDAAAALPRIMNELQGKYSQVDAMYTDWVKTYKLEDVWLEVAKGEQGDMIAIENWRNVHGSQMKLAVLKMRAQIAQLANTTVAGNVEGFVPQMSAYKDRYDDLLSELDGFVKFIDSSAEDLPTALQQMETLMTIRGNTPYFASTTSMPEHANVTSFMTHGPGRVLSEVAGNLPSTNGIALANKYSSSIQSVLGTMYPEFFKQGPGKWARDNAVYYGSTGALQIPPGAGPAEIEVAINSHLQDGKNSFVIPTRTDEEEIVAALHNAQTHATLWEAAEGVVTVAHPDYANNALLGLTYSLTFLNQNARKPADVSSDIMTILEDGLIDRAVDISLSGDDGGRRQAFAKAAETFYIQSKPIKRRQEHIAEYQSKTINGVPLSDLARVDADAINRGEFGWVIQPETLEVAAKSEQARRQASRSNITMEQARSLVESEVNRTMSEIRKEVNKQVRIERTLNKAKADNPDSFRQEDSFTAIFKGENDPDQKRAWAYGFEYTSRPATRTSVSGR